MQCLDNEVIVSFITIQKIHMFEILSEACQPFHHCIKHPREIMNRYVEQRDMIVACHNNYTLDMFRLIMIC